jgi:hypothetical protein
MFEKTLKTGLLVEKILRQHPEYRDDDYRLIAYVLYIHGGEKKLEQISALEFLQNFAAGKYPHPESIRRMRAKLQEQYPELRGNKYEKRKEESKKFRDEFKKN